MAGRIRREDIDELRSRVNIVDVVSQYVTLKRAGVGSMKGLCPFHDERTPSFHVRPAVGRYHCFGCGEDGDVFGFAMAMDHTTFVETVERFAAQANFTLRYEDGEAPKDDGINRSRLLEANAAAAEYFQEQLLTDQALPGQQFLGERGFDLQAAQHFGVGFAPNSFDSLRSHLRRRGFSELELVTAGLLSEGQRGPYDRFRGRLTWPIRDVTGATVGFGARKLLDDDKGPKYLNTPETPVFHKSRVLYGLDLAKRTISRSREAVIVEGYTDVMACHLAGVTTAVATCGTAFGADHVKLLRRVLGDVSTPDTRSLGRVVFTFDPDEAGQKAASRAFAEEQRFAAQTFVATPPEGLDPCDLRIQRGDQAVQRLVQNPRPMFEFMLQRVIAEFDLETVEGRVQATRAAAPILAGIRDRALADGYVRTVAGWLGVDPIEVTRQVRANRRDARAESEPLQHPQATLGNDPATRLEREALVAMLQQGGLVPRDLAERAVIAYVADPSLEIVRDAMLVNISELANAGFADLVSQAVPETMVPLVRELSMSPIQTNEKGLDHYVRGSVKALVQRDMLREKAQLQGQAMRMRAKDADAARELDLQVAALETERRKLIDEHG
ncbi:MAG: DNA primase [Agrococcus casei]